MLIPWQIDITASDRAAAIARIRRAFLPPAAEQRLVSLVQGESYTWGGMPNPDQPLRVTGRGVDHGSYVSIETARLAAAF